MNQEAHQIPSSLNLRVNNSKIVEDANWKLYTGYCLNACLSRRSPMNFDEWMNLTSSKSEDSEVKLKTKETDLQNLAK